MQEMMKITAKYRLGRSACENNFHIGSCCEVSQFPAADCCYMRNVSILIDQAKRRVAIWKSSDKKSIAFENPLYLKNHVR